MSGLHMKYFVLNPAGDGTHAKACRAAMRTYADVMEPEMPLLAAEVRAWVDTEDFASKGRWKKGEQFSGERS